MKRKRFCFPCKELVLQSVLKKEEENGLVTIACTCTKCKNESIKTLSTDDWIDLRDSKTWR